MEMTAFVVFPYEDPYEKVYEKVIVPILSKMNFKAIRGDEIEQSTPYTDDIHNFIENSELVVVIVSPENENIYYELGVASALKKELILLSDNPKNLPSNTRHVRHLEYTNSDLESLSKKFEDWVQNSSAHQLNQRRQSPATLKRGDVFEDLLDATIFMEQAAGDPYNDILNSIKNNQLINPKYIYQSDRGTRLWIELCGDPEYTYFSKSVNILRSFLPDVLSLIDPEVMHSFPDVVSLGPGNGVKDKVFLRELLASMPDGGGVGYYYPFDISPSMITHAVRNVLDVEELKLKLKIKAAVADFGFNLGRFAPMYQFRPEKNIFLFLGNTLGNFDGEVAVLERIRNAMLPGDYMLLEVRAGSSDAVELGGSKDRNNKFDFNPLHRLGVSFDREKLHYEYNLRNRSQIEGTKTAVVSYNDFSIPASGETFDRALLSYIHEYNPSKMSAALESIKFKILGDKSGEGFHYFFLKNGN